MGRNKTSRQGNKKNKECRGRSTLWTTRRIQRETIRNLEDIKARHKRYRRGNNKDKDKRMEKIRGYGYQIIPQSASSEWCLKGGIHSSAKGTPKTCFFKGGRDNYLLQQEFSVQESGSFSRDFLCILCARIRTMTRHHRMRTIFNMMQLKARDIFHGRNMSIETNEKKAELSGKQQAVRSESLDEISKERLLRAKKILSSTIFKYLHVRGILPKKIFVEGPKMKIKGPQKRCVASQHPTRCDQHVETIIISSDASYVKKLDYATMAIMGRNAEDVPLFSGMAWTKETNVNTLEAMAVAWGLKVGQRLFPDYSRVIVESDAKNIIDMLKRGKIAPNDEGNMTSALEISTNILKEKLSVCLNHVPRDHNRVMDHFARVARKMEPEKIRELQRTYALEKEKLFWEGFEEWEEEGGLPELRISWTKVPMGLKTRLLKQVTDTILESEDKEEGEYDVNFPTMNGPSLKKCRGLQPNEVQPDEVIKEWVEELASRISEFEIRQFIVRHKAEAIHEELTVDIHYHPSKMAKNPIDDAAVDDVLKNLLYCFEIFQQKASVLPRGFSLELYYSNDKGVYEDEVDLPTLEFDLGRHDFRDFTLSFKIRSQCSDPQVRSLNTLKEALNNLQEIDIPFELKEVERILEKNENQISMKEEDWE